MTKKMAKTPPRKPLARRFADHNQIDIYQKPGRYTALGYHSARIPTAEGRAVGTGADNIHTQYDLKRLIDQSREFMRDNGIYNGMINRAVNYIVGNGFKLQARSSDVDFNTEAEKVLKSYWLRPEITGVLSGKRVERMICKEVLVAGHTGTIKTNKGLLQLIEAEQIIGTGANSDGIKKNAYGAPVSFSICPYGRGGYPEAAKAQLYTPDQFLFITDPERPSGIKGVPPCQASFPMLHRINDVCDSEAISWQTLSRLAVAITRDQGAELEYSESVADDVTTNPDQAATRITELGYALMFHGKPGDRIEGIDRNIPGQNFSASLTMFLRLMGLPLGLPLEIILLDWTKSNYSQSRAVLEQAYQTFLGWQELLEDFFYRPVYEWVIGNAIRAKKIKTTPPNDYLGQEWIKPTFPWIDQLNETQAYGAKVDRGFTTYSHVCKSLNSEREDVIVAREKEIRDAITIAQNIKTDFGVDVPWQHFAGLEASKNPPPASGDLAAMAPADQGGPEKQLPQKETPDDGQEGE